MSEKINAYATIQGATMSNVSRSRKTIKKVRTK
jgi:hypothetical protein